MYELCPPIALHIFFRIQTQCLYIFSILQLIRLSKKSKKDIEAKDKIQEALTLLTLMRKTFFHIFCLIE